MISLKNQQPLHGLEKMKQILRSTLLLLYAMLPYGYQRSIEREAQYAGFLEKPKTFVSNFIVAFLIGSVIFYGISSSQGSLSPIARFIISLVIASMGLFMPYYILVLMAESRRKDMESVLPDLLLLTSANIKSGMTIDRALLFASRPEFGMLGREVKRIAFQIYGGKALSEAFSDLTKKIKSDILQRTISLLLEGLRSGGAVAKLLEESATDIRNTELLKKEIKASVMMYGIFIFMAAVLGAPFLFAIANFLVHSSVSMWAGNTLEVDSQFMSGGFIQIHTPQIDLQAFGMFSLGAIIITTFFAGILISFIMTGNAKAGLKYVPVFMASGMLLYLGAKALMFTVFSGFTG